MTINTAAFAERVMDAFMRRVEAGPLPAERMAWDGRCFMRDVCGRRCYWVRDGGVVETSILSSHVLEAPRDQLAYNVYDLEPADEDHLATLATDELWEQYQLRMDALTAAARVHGVEVGPDNSRLFIFGLLSKSWTEDNARYESGRLDIGVVVRGAPLDVGVGLTPAGTPG